MTINALEGADRPSKPLEKYHIKITRGFWRKLDYDNMVASMKIVVDAFRHSSVQIIKDDTYAMTGEWEVIPIHRPRKEGGQLIVEITEV